MIRTAIMIDGAFYRKRAFYFWGEKTPHERAKELYQYCWKHINDEKARLNYIVYFIMIALPQIKKYIILC